MEKKPFNDYSDTLQKSTVWAISLRLGIRKNILCIAFRKVNPFIYMDESGKYSISKGELNDVENKYLEYIHVINMQDVSLIDL